MRAGNEFRRSAVLSLFVFVSASAFAGQAAPVPAHRLVVRFADGGFEIVSRTEVTKVLPPSDELPPDSQASGFWYELRSASGRLIYRRIIDDPCHIRFEGPADGVAIRGRRAAPVRSEAFPGERTFSLLVPRAGPGDELVLMESPHERERRDEAAAEVARLAPGRDIR
jgi:hypothetical protein